MSPVNSTRRRWRRGLSLVCVVLAWFTASLGAKTRKEARPV